MKYFVISILILFMSHSFAAELDPSKNGANSILKKAMGVLPEEKRDNVNLAFLSDEVNGQKAAQQIYEMLESGKFKGVLAIGGNNPLITDKLARTITHYLTRSLTGVTLVIAGLDTTEESVAEKLRSLGAEVYFIPNN